MKIAETLHYHVYSRNGYVYKIPLTLRYLKARWLNVDTPYQFLRFLYYLPWLEWFRQRRVIKQCQKDMGVDFEWVFPKTRVRLTHIKQARTFFVGQFWDTEEIVEKQHLLWRYGYGFAKSKESYGPTDWGYCSNQTVCVDQSGLSRDKGRILSNLTFQKRQMCRERLTQTLIDGGMSEAKAITQTAVYDIRTEGLNEIAFFKNWRKAVSDH